MRRGRLETDRCRQHHRPAQEKQHHPSRAGAAPELYRQSGLQMGARRVTAGCGGFEADRRHLFGQDRLSCHRGAPRQSARAARRQPTPPAQSPLDRGHVDRAGVAHRDLCVRQHPACAPESCAPVAGVRVCRARELHRLAGVQRSVVQQKAQLLHHFAFGVVDFGVCLSESPLFGTV